MKYNNLTLGQIEAIANKLGGEQGINDFLAGKTKVIPKEKEVLSEKAIITNKSVFYLLKRVKHLLYNDNIFEENFFRFVDEYFPALFDINQLKFEMFSSNNFFDLQRVYGDAFIKTPTRIAQEMLLILTLWNYQLVEYKEFFETRNIWFFKSECGQVQSIGLEFLDKKTADKATWEIRLGIQGKRIFLEKK